MHRYIKNCSHTNTIQFSQMQRSLCITEKFSPSKGDCIVDYCLGEERRLWSKPFAVMMSLVLTTN